MNDSVAFGRGPPVNARQRVVRRQAQGGSSSAAPRRITHPSVAFVFDPERDAKLSAPYWELGDPVMESADALARRAELRTHPAVHDALRRLTRAAFQFDGEGMVTQQGYLATHACISRVLAPNMSPADAAAAAEREWAHDSGGLDQIGEGRVTGAWPRVSPALRIYVDLTAH
jgi:hypothetical protein